MKVICGPGPNKLERNLILISDPNLVLFFCLQTFGLV